jgi:endonuclease YncB( thermonuclease family)
LTFIIKTDNLLLIEVYMIKILFAVFFVFVVSISIVFAQSGLPIVITQVLQGDTLVVSGYNGLSGGGGTGYVVHIAGIDSPPTTMQSGPQAIAFTSNIALNQYANMIIVATGPNNHVIARVNLGRNGEGKDLGAEIIKAGYAVFRSDDNNGLSAVQSGGYPDLQRVAKYGKRGLWSGGNLSLTMMPDSFRNLQTYKYGGVYIQGTDNVTQSTSDFNRPSVNGTNPSVAPVNQAQGGPQPSSLTQTGTAPTQPQAQASPAVRRHQPTGPNDWRNYSY